MKKPPYIPVLTALFVGVLGGYFVGDTLNKGKVSHRYRSSSGELVKPLTPRAAFMSSDEDTVDYEKLARVCLTAASRNPHKTAQQGSIFAEPNSPEVEEVKVGLDSLMSASLDKGVWTRGASFRTRILLRRLPASDVADFEQLLRTTLERGDLKPQTGAWVPAVLN